MFRCWFSLAFARSLVAFALPLLPNFRGRRRAGGFDHQRLWASNEFGFAHAIEAYEELIDAHVSQVAHVAHAWRPR